MGRGAWVAVVTFADILADEYRRLGFESTPATGVQTRLKAFTNQRHRQILAMPGMSQLRDDSITFASVASTPNYALGPAIAKIKDIYDGATNQLKLIERTLAWVRTADPRLTNSGTPESWIPLSIKQVQAQPSAATALFVKSTAGGDTTQTAFIETVRTGGYGKNTYSVALTGATGAQFGTASDHIEVDKFYLSAVGAGTITLETAASGGTVLASLAIGQTSQQYRWIQLWPTPSAVVTYTVDYTREIADLVNDTDIPFVPPDYHYLLSLGARIDEYEKMDDNRRVPLLREWDLGIGRLKNHVLNSPDLIIVPGGQRRGDSNLGPWYPAGSGW